MRCATLSAAEGNGMRVEKRRQGTSAALAFGVGLVGAFFVLLRVGPEQGFFFDEWDYLSARTAWSGSDLLRPHNEHWSTLPILLYRAWYRLFGLESYVPYRALSVAAHLAAATVMRLVLRRVGLGPWLATAVVLPWVLFGSGWENIVWGFQVAWSGALTLALTQLLLADHDGQRDRRDVVGLLAGLAGIMCAGIAVPLTATVGLCLLLRRGWRVAVLHVLPLAVVYGLWSASYGDTSLLKPAPGRDKLAFMWSGVSTSVGSFSWVPGVGAVVAAAVLTLVLMAFRVSDPAERRLRLAIPIGLALGAVGYLYVVVSGRAFLGADYASASRYQHVVMFLLLPLVGIAALTAIDLARIAAPRVRNGLVALVLVALWVGIPGNLGKLAERDPARLLYRGQLDRVEALAAAVRGRSDLPADGQPLGAAPLLTVGWLREATRDGTLSANPTRDPRTAASVEHRLELLLVDVDADDDSACAPLTSPVALDLDRGESVSLKGLSVLAEVTGPTGSRATAFNLMYGHTLYATVQLSVVLSPVNTGIQICH